MNKKSLSRFSLRLFFFLLSCLWLAWLLDKSTNRANDKKIDHGIVLVEENEENSFNLNDTKKKE